jgi:hypothetical protein
MIRGRCRLTPLVETTRRRCLSPGKAAVVSTIANRRWRPSLGLRRETPMAQLNHRGPCAGRTATMSGPLIESEPERVAGPAELADRRDLADTTDFDQFAAEPVPQRAFRSQFFQQRFGPLGRLTGELRLGEQLPPTARYFLFGEQSSTLCQQPRDAASCLEPSSIVGGSRAAAMSGEHVFHLKPLRAPPRANQPYVVIHRRESQSRIGRTA